MSHVNFHKILCFESYFLMMQVYSTNETAVSLHIPYHFCGIELVRKVKKIFILKHEQLKQHTHLI
jgi:hypothetical protein